MATAAYLAVVSILLDVLQITSVALIIYLIAALQIFNTYLIATFEACLRAIKPQAIGYGLLIEEVVKVSLAYGIFVGTGELFLGAIAGIVVGALAQAVFYIWLLKDHLGEAVRWDYLREWLRGGSVAFIYNAVGVQLVNISFYLLVFFGGQAALGDYQAAVTFSTVIGYASSLSFALYPKMLAKDSSEDAATTFKSTLMFAMPMAVVTLTMSRSLLTILNSSYAIAWPVLILLTVDALVVLVSQFYGQFLMGSETLDSEGKIQIRELLHSKIFKVYTLSYLQAVIALPTIYYILTQVPLTGPVQAAECVVLVNIVVHAISFSILQLLIHREFRLPVPSKDLAKYISAAIISAAVLFVLPQTTTLTTTFGKVLMGLGTYAVVLLAIDADARKLGSQIVKEVRDIFR